MLPARTYALTRSRPFRVDKTRHAHARARAHAHADSQRLEILKELANVAVKRDKDVKSYLVNFYNNIPVTPAR